MDDPHAPLPPMPEFEDFYEAVHGRDPFPWQARLARQVLRDDQWPEEISVPTGLGKTACLDVAVWWLASQAHRAPDHRSAPTRIWWVVNRRLLVDVASEHAQSLSAMLRDPRSEERDQQGTAVLEQAGSRLASLAAPGGKPLHTIGMRGGLTLQRPPNPAQPSVIVSTIPMYGSRLLFRGFGSSRSMRPIDAALAGTDSLVLIDEAHLAQHLRDLIPKLRQCVPESTHGLLPDRRSTPQVVALTATGDATSSSRFEIGETDRSNPVIRRRLNASKPMEIDDSPRGDTPKALHEAAVKLLSGASSPASCVIFCNTPSVARAVYSLLKANRKISPDADLVLLTGRIRQSDADRIKERLLSPTTGAPAGRTASGELNNRKRHLVVVATQTLEVGADLDFEYLVTEQCGVRALTQRLGRLNRLGDHPDAKAVYIHRPPPKKPRSPSNKRGEWPVYGTEPKIVYERLHERQKFDPHIDLNPGTIAEIMGKPEDDPGRAPEILAEILWEWVKTTTPPLGEAPVEPYFSGIATSRATVSVVWRAHVPSPGNSRNGASEEGETDEQETLAGRKRLWPRVRNDETVEIPRWDLQDALSERNFECVVRKSKDRNFLEQARLKALRPGDLVVLASDQGFYDEFGWAPDAKQTVQDLSILRSGLPLDCEALERLLGNSLEQDKTRELNQALDQTLGKDPENQYNPEEPSEESIQEGALHLLELLRECQDTPFGESKWETFLDGLEYGLRDNTVIIDPPNEIARIELQKPENLVREDEFDELSLQPQSVELIAHGDAVGKRAEQVASALGLPKALVKVIRQAGTLHDIGKADERFQRWLNSKSDPRKHDYIPAAKSAMPRSQWSAARKAAGWPWRGRHEELSARLVKAWIAEANHGLDHDEQDLLLHLVVSHHGKGRPLVPPVADGSMRSVSWDFEDGKSVRASADLSEADWDQPGRFQRLHKQYGPWGVAILEAVIRQADHEVSAGVEGAVNAADTSNDPRIEVR